MEQCFYLNELTEKLNTTLDPSSVKNAYKGIFIKKFKNAKEYLEYGYKSIFDLEYGLYYPPLVGLKYREDILKELENLDNQFKYVIEEFKEYGYSFEEFENSDEWQTRKALFNTYKYYLSMYYFNKIVAKDLFYKNAKKITQYNFAQRKGLGNQSPEKRAKEEAKKLFEKTLNDYSSNFHKEKLELNDSIESLISEYGMKYREFHNENKNLPTVRQNDVKNAIIIYLAKKEFLLGKLRAAETSILSKCSSTPYIKVCKLKDLNLDDIRWDPFLGYNVYHISQNDDKNEVLEIRFIGASYNRMACFSDNKLLIRNDEYVVINPNQNGTPLKDMLDEIKPSFYDNDEDELNENYLMMVRYLNPIIEELYPDKFKILDDE